MAFFAARKDVKEQHHKPKKMHCNKKKLGLLFLDLPKTWQLL
jgi:hypothetical protein